MGDYTGEVPGTHGLCAKVSSDCNNPDIMFYTVSNCEERGHIYEGKDGFLEQIISFKLPVILRFSWNILIKCSFNNLSVVKKIGNFPGKKI